MFGAVYLYVLDKRRFLTKIKYLLFLSKKHNNYFQKKTEFMNIFLPFRLALSSVLCGFLYEKNLLGYFSGKFFYTQY